MRLARDADALAAVDAVLETFFAERISRAGASSAAYELLWRRMRESSHGGKRVRPQLLLLAHRLLGGTADEDALLAAAAVELLHSALLFHDDILDGDLVRRGGPNLQGRFVTDALDAGVTGDRARTWGDTAGLLGGDLLISAAHALIARISSPARAEVHEIFDDCLFTTASGELSDVGFGVGMVRAEPSGIIRMMADKTATYSFAAPLRIGAALAGAPRELSADLGAIGVDMGFVYQLRDDVLGVFGDPAHSGKSTDGDLREGKRTLLIAHAETSAPWQEVSHLFGQRDIDDDDVQRLRDAISESGATDAVSQMITHRGDQLLARIDSAPLPERLRADLRTVARRCAERDA